MLCFFILLWCALSCWVWSLFAAFVLCKTLFWCLSKLKWIRLWLYFIFHAIAWDLTPLSPRLLKFPKSPVWKKVNVTSHLKTFSTDHRDLGCFVLHTNEPQASKDERGAAHDNKARLKNSWVEVSWLQVRRYEESEELWFSKWMKWALCDSCSALSVSVEPAGGSPSTAAACLSV